MKTYVVLIVERRIVKVQQNLWVSI